MANSKKDKQTMLTARVPAKLVKALDKAADRAERTRTGELIYRLQESLRSEFERSPA
jgi:hypothetical protein